MKSTKELTSKPFGINVFPEAADPYGFSKATIEAGSGGGNRGGMGGASYHMASFDYAYRCVAAMEWLFQ